jgi:TRAP-type C4-dicarboxylate transport system permease small subunit
MLGTFFSRTGKILSFFEEWTLFISVFAALTALFAHVVFRFTMNYSLAWAEELVRLVIIYTTFIGCSLAIRDRSMIRIDATVQIFPFLKIPLTFISNFVVIIFSFMMIWFGCKMALLQFSTGQKTIIMQIPLVYLYGIMPLSGFLMLFRTIQVMYEDSVDLLKNRKQN